MKDAMPWMIDSIKFTEARDDVRPDLDIELATVMFLAENFRTGAVKLTRKGKRAKVTSILKLGWPMWLAAVGNNQCIFVDGLKTTSPRILSDLNRSSDAIQQQIQSLEPAQFLKTLAELDSATLNPEKFTTFDGLLQADLFNGLQKLVRYRTEDRPYTVPLPVLVKEDQVKAIAEFVRGYPARLAGILAEANKSMERLRAKRDQAAATVDVVIGNITKEYDQKYQELDAQVTQTIARLNEEEKGELAKLEELRATEKENVISLIKETIAPFKGTIELVNSVWTDGSAKILACASEEEMKAEVSHEVGILRQKTAELDRAAGTLEADLQKHIVKFGAIDQDFNKRVQDVQAAYVKRVQEEKDKLTRLAKEKEDKISEQEQLKLQTKQAVGKCESNLTQFVNRKEEKTRIVENMKVPCQLPGGAAFLQFYFPIYYFHVEEEGDRQWVVVPPTVVGSQPQKKDAPQSFEQKTLPFTLADDSFLKYYNEKFHGIVQVNPEIADLIRENTKSPQNNLLLTKDNRELAVKGLGFLKQRNLGKPKDLDKEIENVKALFGA